MAKLIGTDPNQVPTNADLGTMAYQDYDVVAPQFLAGGRRNLLINGDFKVSQRGDYTSATSLTSSAKYYVDRWAALVFSGSAGTIQKVTDQTLPNGVITDSLKVLVNGAGSQYALWQHVEDFKVFRGQEATISFWYKSNCDQAFNYYTYAAQTHIPLPNTQGQWVYFTHTRKHEANATGMRIEVYPYAVTLPSGGYLELAQVQLELGKVATPFEHRPYGEELTLCQRYFQNIENAQLSGARNTGTRLRLSAPLHPQMRTNPTIARVSGTTVLMQTDGGGLNSTSTSVAQGTTAGVKNLAFDLADFIGAVDRSYVGASSYVGTAVFTADAEL